MYLDTTAPVAFRPRVEARGRTATVEFNSGFASRGMPWELRCYGSGKSTSGCGMPGHYRDQAMARRKAAGWIQTGVAPADQRDDADPLRPVELVTAVVQEPDARLMELLLTDRALTAAEWAELAVFEELAA
ncbi:hypothetical protein [Sphingomonas sp. PB4P5]|uniref:hypothetical protein n=1 Tax=Parasphingomonas puruogangriensis TaxID=3096155 RepID=UPI002FC85422